MVAFKQDILTPFNVICEDFIRHGSKMDLNKLKMPHFVILSQEVMGP